MSHSSDAPATILTVWFMAIGIASAAYDEPKAGRPPNIVFILADDVGREVLRCYGGTSYRTPNLDALAAGGMKLQHCYSMPVCHPTRVCFLTGRYPLHLGNPGWGTFPETAERQTVAHALKEAGYATAVAGKWQLALLRGDPQHPHRLGFDEYCLFGWHEGPRYYRPLIWQNGKLRQDVASRYGPDVYCEFLLEFIAKNRERPFFAFYSMTLCHEVTNDLEQPVPRGPKGRYDTYEEMAEAMDERVGRVVTGLDQFGLRRQTLVFYTTDNGTPDSYIATAEDQRLIKEPIVSMMGNREIRGGKGSLTDDGTRVPAVANWPGTIEPGQVSNDLVDFSDFLPTFAELAGATLPQGVQLDGHSFAVRLRGGNGAPRPWAFAQRDNRFFVRTRRWKLYDDGLFYDMASDPGETQPIKTNNGPAEARVARQELLAVVNSLLARSP